MNNNNNNNELLPDSESYHVVHVHSPTEARTGEGFIAPTKELVKHT